MSESILNDVFLKKVYAYVDGFYQENVSSDFAYHNFEHTTKVAQAVEIIASKINLSEESKNVVLTAALFHDTGVHKGHDDHEMESVNVMRDFLSSEKLAGLGCN